MRFILSIKNRLVFALSIVGFILLGCNMSSSKSSQVFFSRSNFPDILNIHNVPEKPVDWSAFCFSDKGAWFGFALPDSKSQSYTTSFIGPFLMTNQKWLAKSILNLKFFDAQKKLISPEKCKSVYLPGKLVVKSSYLDFDASMELIFATSKIALITIKIYAKNSIDIYPQFSGQVFPNIGLISKKNNHTPIITLNNKSEIGLYFASQSNIGELLVNDTSYSCSYKKVDLNEKSSKLFNIAIYLNDKKQSGGLSDSLAENSTELHDKYFIQNKLRWNSYLTKTLQTKHTWSTNKKYQRIVVKSIETLINNWRSAYGDLHYDGLFPSYGVNYFNGFWAWDSWKHSIALSIFAPELAKNQIRAMYNYQNSAGMIPDCIYADSTQNNWLNTKPPLSGWAIWKVFENTNDTSFLRELYPKLLKYHNWWYKYRDCNNNGLCEYGSSDNSLVAAKWESGMDNAIRFDSSKMVKVKDGTYAFNQESVDLNSYLYSEKLFIVKMAKVLNDFSTLKKFDIEANVLKNKISSTMFDYQTGYFYDKTIEGKFVKVLGPEGWSPLFNNVATKTQAKSVANVMFDTTKFSTFIPFPTASKSEKEFSTGYWRGPIWLDQVYFAIKGLRNYGYNAKANSYTEQVFNNIKQLSTNAPIRENYWPLSGKGMRVNHFSWSAAHLILLYKY